MIEIARQEMIPRLKEIWKNCFHDEDWYIDFYYKERFTYVETLVNTVDGVPVAMTTLIPGEIAKGITSFSARYVYAVATDPVWQGKGKASELLSYIKQRVGIDYQAVFLVPATTDLFDYYKKFGYQTVCDKKMVSISINEVDELCSEGKEGLELKKLTALQLYQMREEKFLAEGYVRWDVDALDYVMQEYRFCHGQAVKVELEQETGSLFYYYDEENKILYIKETSLTQSGLNRVIKELAHKYKIEQIKITTSEHSNMAGKISPFVMAYGEGINNLNYANFIKD